MQLATMTTDVCVSEDLMLVETDKYCLLRQSLAETHGRFHVGLVGQTSHMTITTAAAVHVLADLGRTRKLSLACFMKQQRRERQQR